MSEWVRSVYNVVVVENNRLIGALNLINNNDIPGGKSRKQVNLDFHDKLLILQILGLVTVGESMKWSTFSNHLLPSSVPIKHYDYYKRISIMDCFQFNNTDFRLYYHYYFFPYVSRRSFFYNHDIVVIIKTKYNIKVFE